MLIVKLPRGRHQTYLVGTLITIRTNQNSKGETGITKHYINNESPPGLIL